MCNLPSIPKQRVGLIEVIKSLDKNSSIGPRPLNDVWFAVSKGKKMVLNTYLHIDTNDLFVSGESAERERGMNQFFFLNFIS